MKLKAYLAAGGQTLIAAGTFLVAKDATHHFSPLELSWFRIMVSGVLVGAIYLGRMRTRNHPPRRDWAWLALLGILGVTLNQMFFLFGINLSTPLHASLLYAFTPVMVLLAGTLWLGERFSWIRTLGVALAVLGVMLVLTAQGLDLTRGPVRGDLLILMAVVAWSAYTLVGKRVLRRHEPFTVIAWAFGFAALSVIPLTPWVWDGFDPRTPGLRGWSAILYLSVMTSGVAFTLWYYALKRLDASQTAVFTNLQAPLTALLVFLVFGTIPGMQVIAGGVLVLLGVTVVQLRLQ